MPSPPDDAAIAEATAYHEATKHHFGRAARGPRGLDWATQPDPFLRYEGAPLLPLDHVPVTETPRYEEAFVEGKVPVQRLDRSSVSQLLGDSLALSAWKEAGTTRWPLRINPSSGNLHPTEGYLVCGPVPDLCETPMVGHYAPREHGLEQRLEFHSEQWRRLTAGLPESSIFVGLTSIHWREAWKYGERAFRYCQHDVGHAIAAVSLAAAGLGWRATLLDEMPTDAVGRLLGVSGREGVEAERAECLLVIHPQGEPVSTFTIPEGIDAFAELPWRGDPSTLSRGHVPWPRIDRVAEATRHPNSAPAAEPPRPTGPRLQPESEPISFRAMIHRRRSAVALDGHTGLAREGLWQILRKTRPGPGQFPFNALPWAPRVHLAMFVHRIGGLAPGLYCQVRDPSARPALQAAMRDDFDWALPEGCPEELGFHRLTTADARQASAHISCHQDIAADGCFSLGMIAEFERPLRELGAWTYPRLFWECGVIGQALYLEAEAFGLRGTGIGCFFDDPMHELLGLSTRQFQSLYHFTVGGPMEDPRLRTLSAYPPSP